VRRPNVSHTGFSVGSAVPEDYLGECCTSSDTRRHVVRLHRLVAQTSLNASPWTKKGAATAALKFRPSRYHPDQAVGSSADCQRRRRTDYHRKKLIKDPAYREQCLDSQKKWREKNPHYSRPASRRIWRACHRWRSGWVKGGTPT